MRKIAVAVAAGLVTLAACAGQSSAQPDGMDGKQAPLEPGWVDQIGRGPGVLIGWDVRGGQIMDKDGIIHLGGPSPTIARLVTPLSEEFKLLMEYQTADPQSIRVRFYHHSMFSGGFVERRLAPGSAGQWVELTLSGAPRPGGGYEVVHHERHKNGESRSSSTQGDALDWIEIEVPAGQILSIRRLRLLSTAAPAATDPGLYPAVAVLAAFLLGVIGLGWFLNRRQQRHLG